VENFSGRSTARAVLDELLRLTYFRIPAIPVGDLRDGRKNRRDNTVLAGGYGLDSNGAIQGFKATIESATAMMVSMALV
jgi:hypothetical protein